jgi:hypothetical protein
VKAASSAGRFAWMSVMTAIRVIAVLACESRRVQRVFSGAALLFPVAEAASRREGRPAD